MIFTVLLALLLSSMVNAAPDDDTKGAPPFDQKAFDDCAKAAKEKYHSGGAGGYYVCHEDRDAKHFKAFGSYFPRELDNLERCYAETVAKKPELKMPEPHTIEAFEERYGLVEMLLRNHDCKSPNGPDDPSVITNMEKIAVVRATAWQVCLNQLNEPEIEDMKKFYVCRNYQLGQDLTEFFSYITGSKPRKAKAFEVCFSEKAAKFLEMPIDQFNKKYDIGMLIKSMKCKRIPAKPAKQTAWKTGLSWLAKVSNGAFRKIGEAMRKLIPDKPWACLQKEILATTIYDSLLCSEAKRAAIAACFSKEKKDNLPAVPTSDATSKEDEGTKQMAGTLTKVFRKLGDLMCGKGGNKKVSGNDGQAYDSVKAFGETTVQEFGSILEGKTRENRSRGSRAFVLRMKRNTADDIALVFAIVVLCLAFPGFLLLVPFIIMLLAGVANAGYWIMAIWACIDAVILLAGVTVGISNLISEAITNH